MKKKKKDTRKWIVLLQWLGSKRPGIYRGDVTFSSNKQMAFVHPGGDFGATERAPVLSPSNVFDTEKEANDYFVGKGKRMWASKWEESRDSNGYAKDKHGNSVDVQKVYATEKQACADVYRHALDESENVRSQIRKLELKLGKAEVVEKRLKKLGITAKDL